jgi:hypothetical protein
MAAANPDGPLNVSLRRFADREPRIWVQRWKRDHPVTISLSQDEYELLCEALPIIAEQLRIAPKSAEAQGSTLDVGALVQINRGAAA